MKLYADRPGQKLAQLLADVLLLVWVIAWAWAGIQVHDATMELAAPGHQLTESATGLAGSLRDAGGTLAGIPVVGDEAGAPFDGAAGASDEIADVGRAQVEAVERLAWWLGASVVAIPVLLAVVVHVPRRVRFVRRATAGARLVDADADLDLFALRALAHQPLNVLARISDDPAGGWRRGERDVTDRLAELELQATGLARATAAPGRRA